MKFDFENFIKGPLTSLVGILILIAACVCWLIDYLTDTQGLVFGTIGFALLFMRDKLPEFISQFLNNWVNKASTNKPKE